MHTGSPEPLIWVGGTAAVVISYNIQLLYCDEHGVAICAWDLT